jgi:hypothetical protein
MSALAGWPWPSVFDAELAAFCSGVALLVLMMLSSAAVLFRDIIDAAVSHHGALAESLIGSGAHACEECSGDAGPAPEVSTTGPGARC